MSDAFVKTAVKRHQRGHENQTMAAGFERFINLLKLRGVVLDVFENIDVNYRVGDFIQFVSGFRKQ